MPNSPTPNPAGDPASPTASRRSMLRWVPGGLLAAWWGLRRNPAALGAPAPGASAASAAPVASAVEGPAGVGAGEDTLLYTYGPQPDGAADEVSTVYYESEYTASSGAGASAGDESGAILTDYRYEGDRLINVKTYTRHGDGWRLIEEVKY